MKRFMLSGLAALLALTAAAPEAKPMPSFTATGALAATGQAQGKSATFNTSVRVLHRPNLWRIDILKVTASTADPNGTAMIAQFLPKGTVTAVIDQAKNTLTLWSSTEPKFYQTKLALPQPKPKPSATPSSSWSGVLNAMNSMTQYDVWNYSMALTGHQAVNGRTASMFHIISQTQKHGGKLQDVTADLALADDLSGIPIHLSVDAKGDATGTVLIDLSTISTTTPAAVEFAPPPTYKKTANLGEVFLPH